jgi:hypothetical protein
MKKMHDQAIQGLAFRKDLLRLICGLIVGADQIATGQRRFLLLAGFGHRD